MKKLYSLVIFTLILTVFNTIFLNIPTSSASAEDNYTIKTISEIGNPVYAGSGSYYDDGMLYYASGGCTVGYNLDHSNTIFEFDVILDSYSWPAWLSLTLRADGFDRTGRAGGYSFRFFPAGNVDVQGMSEVDESLPLSVGVKYRFQIGALTQADGVLLTLKVDGNQIVSYLDTASSGTGTYFNICGEGSVSARFFSTKKEVFPNYHTYTMATLGEYPTIAGATACKVDKYNNINIYGSGATIGYRQQLQNFSVETNINFDTFGHGSSLAIGMRVGGFDRANSSNLKNKGYVVRLVNYNWGGSVAITKNGASCGTAGFAWAEDTDYVVEFGTVDLDKNRTCVFVNVNNKPVISIIDDSNPLQNKGLITFNGDGSIACRIGSANNRLTPLVTKVKENANYYIVETYFNNTISYTNMDHNMFDENMLNAILINDYTVVDVNKAYYGLDGQDQVNAINLEYIDNKLVITISKNWYLKSTNATSGEVELQTLTLKKTGTTSGLICPSGFVLKQTYYYNF